MFDTMRTPQLRVLHRALRTQLRQGYLLVSHEDEARAMRRSIERELRSRGWGFNALGEVVLGGTALRPMACERCGGELLQLAGCGDCQCAACGHTQPDPNR